MIQVFFSRQFLGFLIAGGFAACINFSSRFLYSLWFPFSTSVIIAYITGMITAFTLSRLFVFQQSTQQMHVSVFYFILVNLFALAQTWAVSMILAKSLFPAIHMHWHAEAIAHGIGICVPAFSSYIAHKKWTFQTKVSH